MSVSGKENFLFLEPIDASYVLSHLSVSFSNPCPCVVIALLTASRPCQYGPSHLVSPSSILIFAPSKLFHLFTQIAPVHLTFGPWPPNKTTHSVNSCPCHRPVPSQCWTFDRNGAINHPKCFRFGNSTLMNQNPQCHNHSFQECIFHGRINQSILTGCRPSLLCGQTSRFVDPPNVLLPSRLLFHTLRDPPSTMLMSCHHPHTLYSFLFLISRTHPRGPCSSLPHRKGVQREARQDNPAQIHLLRTSSKHKDARTVCQDSSCS